MHPNWAIIRVIVSLGSIIKNRYYSNFQAFRQKKVSNEAFFNEPQMFMWCFPKKLYYMETADRQKFVNYIVL